MAAADPSLPLSDAHPQAHQLDAALASFLDLLLLLDSPAFALGPPELRASLQLASTLEQLVATPAGAAAVQRRLQAVLTQLPLGLRHAVSAPPPLHPLRLALERLLRRPGADERWLEAVLAAYVTVAVLPAAPAAAAAAEQHLLAALGGLQAAAAAQELLQQAAQHAAAAAAAQLAAGGGSSSAVGCLPDDRRRLCAEALRHLTSPACLEAAAAAQLLLQYAQPGEQQQDQQQPSQRLATLLHSPPTALELELLCLAALLPGWEATLRRLAGLLDEPASRAGGSSSGDAAADAAACQAVTLLCDACASQPEAVLGQHPALLAEVCRQSFRFTCAFAPLLVAHLRTAASGTRPTAEAARWRAEHAAKHADHVTDYLLAKGCSPAGVEAMAAAAGGDAAGGGSAVGTL